MRVRALLDQFLEDVRTQRLRTALTVLGITWGTVAVVVLLAFGVGLQTQMTRNARGLGDGIVIVFGGKTTKAFEGFPDGRSIRLREEDVAALRRDVPEIGEISPEYGRRDTPVRRGEATTNPYVTGVIPIYGEMRNINVDSGGRFLDALDLRDRRRVAVLGDAVKRLLFGDGGAVGRRIEIGGVPFTVVGVMRHKTQNSSYSARDQDRLFMPASTYRAVFGETTLHNIVYKPVDPRLSKASQRAMYRVLGRRDRFDPSDEDALGVWDTTEQMKMFRYLFGGFNLFLAVVGSFTLLVGGIGVANIMYVVVRERRREIGIKRSLGARRRDILGQFLGETFLIVAVGALLGLLISVAVVEIAARLPLQDSVGVPILSPVALAGTVALLGGIAFLAGLFPARKAAALDPVECMRG